MVAWYWLMIVASFFTLAGFILGVMIRSGSYEDLNRELYYWRTECRKVYRDHGLPMPKEYGEE
jgi:hypothetical protein